LVVTRRESVNNWTGILDLTPIKDLDPGIAPWVEILRAHRVETFESCQGGDGHSFHVPTVRFHGGPGEAYHAYSVAVTHALPVKGVARHWRVIDGELTGPDWEITFRRQATSQEYEDALRVLAFERGER
jgi:hypothetical protein